MSDGSFVSLRGIGLYARYRTYLMLGFVVLLNVVGLSAPAEAGERAKMISSSQVVLDQWSVDQHLYVKGNVAVGRASLDGLEQWLDQHGENWTVVLMEGAGGEVWKDIRGVSYYGMDAAENALGRGLSNKQAFAAQTDHRTGQSNGAVLVIFLKERKFSYFGSDVYDRRGLGESAWSGNLDRQARDAMRHGGRILDAVKNTVKHIDGRLSKRIASEQRLQREAKEHRTRLIAMTQREVIDLRREIVDLDTELGRFRELAEVRAGDIADPALPQWQRELDAAEDALKAGHVETASTSVRGVREKVKGHFKSIRDWHADRSRLDALGTKIESVVLDVSFTNGRKKLTEVQRVYQLSLAGYLSGNSDYVAWLESSEAQLASLERSNIEHAENRIRQEEKALQYQQDVKRLKQGVGMILVLGLGGLGIWSNRRRRMSKGYAEEVFVDWQRETKGRFDRLFKVMDRAGVVVGAEKDLPERGYEGVTLKESLVAIHAVDHAFILSSGVDRVMDEVELLIHPVWPWGKGVNVFSRSRFDRALELMERKPLPVQSGGQGRVKVLDRQQDAMLGLQSENVSEQPPLLFAELVHLFDVTLDQADRALDRVDTAWGTIADRTAELGLALSRVARNEDTLRMASLSDGWLAAERLFSHWHPEARQQHQSGIELGLHDPVAALDGPVDRSEEMVREMELVLAAVQRFRSGRLEEIVSRRDQLRRFGRQVAWVSEAMALMGSDLDALADAGAQRSVMAECELFRDGLDSLSERVAHTVDLAEQSHDELPKLMSAVRREVDAVRGRLSRELHLQKNEILSESDEWNPDLILDQSAGLKQTAEAGLDHGAVEMAFEALQSARDGITFTEEIVRETLGAYGEYQKRVTQGRKLESEAEIMRADGEVVLQQIRDQYAEAVLRDEPRLQSLSERAENNEVSKDGEVLALSANVMSQFVESMAVSLTTAEREYKAGKILQSRRALIDAEDSYEQVQTLHGALQHRHMELKELEAKNQLRLADAQQVLEGQREVMSDPRVCVGTQGVFEQLDILGRDVRACIDMSYGDLNPYQAEQMLDEWEARLKGLDTRITADREAFAEAEQMMAAALRSAKDGARIVEVSRVDGIPDSQETKDEVDLIEACAMALQNCQTSMREAHSPWRKLMNEINREQTRLGEAKAGLKNELRRARLAADSIRMARKVVNQAVMWSGSYGVRITGAPGASPLREAHDYLSQGRYDEATRTAAFARTQVRQAIASAELEEARIRRKREAAERRRRAEAARLRRSRSSSSSSFGRSSGFSSFGSSSRSSSGSSFSSGSGFSRSGW